MRRAFNSNKSAKSKNNGTIVIPQDIIDALERCQNKFIPFNKMEDAVILKYRQKNNIKSFADIGRVLKRSKDTIRNRYIYLMEQEGL